MTVTPAPVLLLPLPGPVPRPVEVLLLPPVAPPAQALIARVEGRALTVIPGVSLASAASDGHITSHYLTYCSHSPDMRIRASIWLTGMSYFTLCTLHPACLHLVVCTWPSPDKT